MATDALVTREADLGYHQQYQFAAALANVSDAVITTDASQHIAYLNPAAESMTGWRAVDAIGKPLDHVFRPVDGQSSGEDSALAPELFVRKYVRPISHVSCTCRMGSDDSAVVDPELRVKGVKRLRVADASVMPRVTSGNTNSVAILIGEKCARSVLHSLN